MAKLQWIIKRMGKMVGITVWDDYDQPDEVPTYMLTVDEAERWARSINEIVEEIKRT